jgi:hypothetical protein
MSEPIEIVIGNAVRQKVLEWTTAFHEEMEEARSRAANDDIRIGLTHGEIMLAKILKENP